MIEFDPALLCLGDTETDKFPLILIFGRKYGSGTVHCCIGSYDFNLSPRSLFWNRAYSLISRSAGCCRMKAFCI